MSEQDNKKSGGNEGSTVMVDKPSSGRQKPYRPTELEQESKPDYHKRSKAPAVPNVADELKNITENETPAPRETMESISEKRMPVSKNISSSDKRRGNSPENIAMASLDIKKESVTTTSQPIPATVDEVDDNKISPVEPKKDSGKTPDDDSITEEKEARTAEPAKGHSEWSDDEEAGGLPRSESRASRVSRAVRQLFCCGVNLHAPSEAEIPERTYSAI